MNKLLTIGFLLALSACGDSQPKTVFYVPVNGVGMVMCRDKVASHLLQDCSVNGFAIQSVTNPQNVLEAPEQQQ